MPCGYKKMHKGRKKRKYSDFNEYEQKYSPRNRHYKGTKGRKFEKLASEIIEERQDKNRRGFMRAEKRLQRNRMAAMRTRTPNFSEGKKCNPRCKKGFRCHNGVCSHHKDVVRKDDMKMMHQWNKQRKAKEQKNRESWNPIKRYMQWTTDRSRGYK